MSSDAEKALAKYVEKMYALQFSEQESILKLSELKQIALDMGLTEEEWTDSQQQFKGYLANGKELLLQQNWEDALTSLEQAISLNPYHLDTLYYKAQAHAQRYEEDGNQQDADQARILIQRALRVKAGYKPALKLLSQLREDSQEKAGAKKSRLFLLIGAVSIVLLLVFYWTMTKRNEIVRKEELVNQAWAQVENVYQRRTDLIPKLIETAKTAADFELALLDKLHQQHQKLVNLQLQERTAATFADYHQKQEALSSILQQLSQKSTTHPTLSRENVFKNLPSQIEGTENRITFERRKYNKAVMAYNSFIRQFPQSLLGFDQKAYFKIEQ